MEFAILSIPLFILLLGVFEASFDLFVQAALDSAVETAARTIQVGSTQGGAGWTSQSLVNAVCPSLSKLLSCSLLSVDVQPVAEADYYAAYKAYPGWNCLSYGGSTGSVNTGQPGQLMVIGAWYNGPSFLGGLVPIFATAYANGGIIHRTFAMAGFVNETFTGGQAGTPAGGC
jgi:Flp pilus assembly protein TadG